MHKVERKADTKAWPEASICSELEDHLERGVTVLLSMDDGMERTVFHRGGAAHVHELCQALQQQYTAIEGAVTDAQNRKLGWQQNLTRYEKHCSSSGSTGDRAREAEIREYYKSHLAVAEAHLLELQELCKPLQACRPLHTQGGVDTHCLAEEESCAGDKGGRNHNAHEELQQALQQSVRFITLTLPVAESRTLQLQKRMRDLDEQLKGSHDYEGYYKKKIESTDNIRREEDRHLQVLQQLARPLQARLHI